MKFNWGTGILIFIILFFIAIFSFVYFASTVKINLGEEDYYPKELAYQNIIDKKNNTKSLPEKITFEHRGNTLIISFPAIIEGKKPGGTILLYRPSDYTLDIEHKINTDAEGRQFISTEQLLPGKYIIKIDWVLDSIQYYQEEIFIN